jgi:hypothetical protein
MDRKACRWPIRQTLDSKKPSRTQPWPGRVRMLICTYQRVLHRPFRDDWGTVHKS